MFEELIRLQKALSERVELRSLGFSPQIIAGCDVGYFEDGLAKAVFILMKYPEFEIMEIASYLDRPKFPYIPGFLSFREAPLLIKAYERLKIRPHLLLVDGQGIAHPRKAGLAVHLGVELKIPTIGCAKKPLLRYEGTLAEERGSFLPIFLNGEEVGIILRTKKGVKPLCVSPGNLITLEEARNWVLKTAIRFRIPEPLRLAHQLSKNKDEGF